MKHWLRSSFVLATLIAPATAQNVVFQDGFENGFAQWTPTGLWNPQQSNNPCMGPAAPFPEGSGAAWFGQTSTCDFNTFPSFGGLAMSTWVTLPATAASVSLYFQSRIESEYCWASWDLHLVNVTAVGGPDGGFSQRLCAFDWPIWADLPWHERRVDLSAYRGAQVKVEFHFSSGDTAENDGLGWLVDNVRIVSEPGVTICPSANFGNSCPCTPFFGVGGGCFNSRSKSATLLSAGTASVASDSLTFTAAEMPLGTAATLFQATAQSTPVTFGDGLLCVTGSLIRLGTQFAPTGSIGWPHPALGPISSAGAVSPSGGDHLYQVIYRDAVPTHCTSATFNQTSAQRVTWSP